ncbi:MAG: type II toxin-antitoxin system PemK/MazF family toxin [Nanoarchaeota archaeon]
MFNQRDIVQIPFPYSDLTGFKKRPALIISNKKLNGPDKVCCLVTSNPQENDLSISKSSFEQGNLPFKSFIRPHRIFTVHEKIIIKKLCTIEGRLHNIVVEKLNDFLKKNS